MNQRRCFFPRIALCALIARTSTPAVAHADTCADNPEAAGCSARKTNWFSLAAQQDFLLLEEEGNICSPASQIRGDWTCLRANGTQYHGFPLPNPFHGVETAGPHVATTRLLVGYDRVFFQNFTLGGRAGFALRGGGPRPNGVDGRDFFPFHGEARVAFWFGSDPFAAPGLRPWVSVAGGMAQVDTMISVQVQEDFSVPRPPQQFDNPPTQTLEAWRRRGRGFASAGVGLAYFGSSGLGVQAEVRWMQLFPDAASAPAIQLGALYGF